MNNVRLITLIIITSVLTGFIAGILGFFIGKFYLTNFSIVNSLYIPDQNEIGNKDIVIQEVKKVVVEQDGRLLQVINKAENSIFKIYKKKILSQSGASSFYSDSDLVSYASVVTSDGLLVTYSPLNLKPSMIVVGDENNIYTVASVIDDPVTKLQFIKLNISGLTVIDYAKFNKINIGQTVFGYLPFEHSVISTYVKDNNYKKYINNYSKVKSVESDEQKILLGSDLGDKVNGLPIMNLNSEILGISVGGELAVKSSYVNFLLKSVLKDGKIIKPYLGINYVNLSEVNGVKSLSNGFMVVRNANGVDVNIDSQFSTLLKEGDIITEIEGATVGQGIDLADYIYEYSMGSVINFKVISQDQQKNISYTLK